MNLYIILSHLDDFELSCFGYVKRHCKSYDRIILLVASKNEYKDSITKRNIGQLKEELSIEIEYENLGFEATKLNRDLDLVKDKIYQEHIEWNSDFDILTHDSDDLHTDHSAMHTISRGLYKYARKFVTIYSPSSVSFQANYFIDLSTPEFELKKLLISRYDISRDESYSKLGYYFENHWNLGMAYVMEHKIKYESQYYDVYRILKWE